ncbi:tRNA (guanine(37)-N1)-methyltransferase [Mitosporidium daphniae]|uniref:tRNA (Guanine(37)-N1)-methyltransferase n=1 Tax=Mitosporidium daphniae TaxID=1485682 RepID=A0A098VQ25_9MICR|nr:tRNA (guanine(37)-N1)-methyltransferase [Mitosporidium daphniae]KGG50864.1 tRNA (guanine(37)-N1)-methyltransferase [Mitosporidium daphniae]|eukprot:XP_013237291.1 tRNA (guanine(37)-N1)-methyltransferase [Mitosporidium daphniae]
MVLNVEALLRSLPRPIALPMDKKTFSFTIPTSAICVAPNDIQSVKNALKEHALLLDLPKIKPIIRDPADARLFILLNDVYAKEEIPIENSVVHEYNLSIDYSYWTVAQIIDAILPPDLDRITAFETIGHIAHLNLTEAHMPYANEIGQVILDKNPSLSVVVTKLGEIDHEFRFFKMNVIAGSPSNLVTTVSESDCRFTLDYSQVYWNSRLAHEHQRLVTSVFKSGELICTTFLLFNR